MAEAESLKALEDFKASLKKAKTQKNGDTTFKASVLYNYNNTSEEEAIRIVIRSGNFAGKLELHDDEGLMSGKVHMSFHVKLQDFTFMRDGALKIKGTSTGGSKIVGDYVVVIRV
ncbi:MAG: hypothetical protein V4543_13540 [Bacteroidota bacterium]